MGLFDKKYCDICGEKIGLLGNRKLADGNMCKACAAKLSPWFSDRRKSTLDDIKKQLDYREGNREAVQAFHVTRSLGAGTLVLLDEDAGKFMVTSARNLADANPDVMDFSQVTGCSTEANEFREEIKRQGPDGEDVSYNPPRYLYRYDFYTTIRVDSPWFDEIRFKLNQSSVEVCSEGNGIFMSSPPQRSSDPLYRQYERLGEEIKNELTKAREGARESVAAANAPRTAMTCPHCGATTVPDANGCCEFCGGAC